MSTPTAPYKAIEYDYTSYPAIPAGVDSPSIAAFLDNLAAMLTSVLAFKQITAYGPSTLPTALSANINDITLLVLNGGSTPWNPEGTASTYGVRRASSLRIDLHAILGPVNVPIADHAAVGYDLPELIERAIAANPQFPDTTGKPQFVAGIARVTAPALRPYLFGRARWREAYMQLNGLVFFKWMAGFASVVPAEVLMR